VLIDSDATFVYIEKVARSTESLLKIYEAKIQTRRTICYMAEVYVEASKKRCNTNDDKRQNSITKNIGTRIKK
jgi:hypothetical protein